ncbi:hypothetical protein KPL78_19630 [Roseomonas sp. HJA6]|uniref:Uncharacterized protein n=1 Tax=Roseomonas alba TaxID=2846776 RepID=A0ABS7ADF2_9PROT|nr:hypothetical protein [Neoroseomonas alba]MBW6400080.1 hypothetical protein [Neoroseomonas alba]
MDSRGALWLLARTALLCGALGLVLYGAVAFLAGLPNGQWVIGLLLSVPMTAFVGWVVWRALREGEFPRRGGAAVRAEQPVAYWFHTLWYGFCALFLAWLAVWCMEELLAAR